MLPSTISVIVIVAVAAASTAAGGGGGAASGAELLNAVPYPNPAFWSHAWPYDDTTAIVVGGEVTVQVAPPSLSNSSSHGDDPVLGEIAARYQALMRGKASAAPMSVLSSGVVCRECWSWPWAWWSALRVWR